MSSTERSAKPVSASRRAPARDDVDVPEFLRKRKVAELQEMWGFWQNGHRPPTRKKELLEPLIASLSDEEVVRSRIEVLSDRPREVLKRLVRADAYRARLGDLIDSDNGRDLESYEVEAAARALSKRGFVQVQRNGGSGGNGGRGGEVYVIPTDLGDLISGLLQEERRGPRQVFSLAGHLAGQPAGRRARALAALDIGLDPETDPEALAEAVTTRLRERGPLAAIEDEALRDVLVRGAVEHGGVVSRAQFEALLGEGVWNRKALQATLEDACLGTITTLALGEYGIELGGETVVLFGSVADQLLDLERDRGQPEHDRVDAARVDLLTDLQQFLNLVATTPLRVTQGRTIYRAAQHRILDAFIFHEDELMDREAVFGILYSLAFGLELVEVTDESRLKLSDKGEAWDSSELTEKVRAIYGRFLDERLPDGRDFHVRRLRRALVRALVETGESGFLPIADVPFRVRHGYLAHLENEGVREQYKNRFQYTYSPPRESPEQLLEGLVGYMVTRLYPLGVVDVALADDVPVGVRLTDLGRRLVTGEALSGRVAEPTASTGPVSPLVVNPDFEVLLFPEGNVNEVAHALGRFANRTKSERVAHYRITREAVERAIVKGMTADEILAFLDERSRTPVPQNVTYSIREWAARVRFAVQREVVLLTTSDASAMEDALATPAVARLLVERIAPTAAVLRQQVTDWKVLELLRGLGVYFR